MLSKDQEQILRAVLKPLEEANRIETEATAQGQMPSSATLLLMTSSIRSAVDLLRTAVQR